MSTRTRNKIKPRVEFRYPPLFRDFIPPFFSLLVFQETAAALTGVTTAHAAHFPSLLTSGDGSPGGQGRRSRPLPAHLASTAPYMGSPFNRRTHKCDYPDCDKVMGLKDSISSLGTDLFSIWFLSCAVASFTLFECDC